MMKKNPSVNLWLLLVLFAFSLVLGGCGNLADDEALDTNTDVSTSTLSADTSVDTSAQDDTETDTSAQDDTDTSTTTDEETDTGTETVSNVPDGKELSDVHGAGAQRSDPKSGNPDDYSEGHGPQGDVVRIFNHARCVRTDSSIDTTGLYPIVDTGQTQCYDDGTNGVITCPAEGEDYFGQDANHEGNQPSYTDNGDGTVTDNITGLMWQQDFKEVAFTDAASDAVSDNTGGYDDWRVPSLKEMYSLMLFSGATGSGDLTSTTVPDDAVPYTDTTVFNFDYPTSGRYIDAQFITSNVYVSKVKINQDIGEQECFFGVNMADGRIKCYPTSGGGSSSTYYARWVRDNTNNKYGQNDFADNQDGTITDKASGLVWMSVDSSAAQFSDQLSSTTQQDGSLNWQEALSFCNDLEYAGQTDWRLPNAKELQSLVDYTRSPDTTNSAAIDPLFSASSITDTAGEADFPWYWSATTHDDGVIEGEFGVYVTFGEAYGLIDE